MNLCSKMLWKLKISQTLKTASALGVKSRTRRNGPSSSKPWKPLDVWGMRSTPPYYIRDSYLYFIWMEPALNAFSISEVGLTHCCLLPLLVLLNFVSILWKLGVEVLAIFRFIKCSLGLRLSSYDMFEKRVTTFGNGIWVLYIFLRFCVTN